jgi:hypothetical protein
LVKAIYKKFHKLYNIVNKRHNLVNDVQTKLLNDSQKISVKRDTELRWIIENNRNKKNQYWTIWYLTINYKMRELQVYLTSKTKTKEVGRVGQGRVNTRDS